MALNVGRGEEHFMVDVNAFFGGKYDFESAKESPASRYREGRRAQGRNRRAGRLATLTTNSLLLGLALVRSIRR